MAPILHFSEIQLELAIAPSHLFLAELVTRLFLLQHKQ